MDKILCIDDEELGLQVRRFMLQSEGFEVAIAADGKTDLELFGKAGFDLVLLDYFSSLDRARRWLWDPKGESAQSISPFFYHQRRRWHRIRAVDYARNCFQDRRLR